MTFLLTLIVLLLITMVVYMTAIAILYVDLVQGEKHFREVSNKTVDKLFSKLEENRKLTEDLNLKMSLRVATLEGSQDFATETINQARRLIRDAKAEVKQELKQKAEPFKYVEPEEDPEEPRS